MARRKTTKITTKKTYEKNASFLPQAVHQWLIRLGQNLLATMIAVSGILILLSLVSYHTSDPSLNTAVSEAENIHNLMGRFGAYSADFFMQSIGFASFLLPLLLIIWAGKLYKALPLRRLWLKIPTAIISFILVAAFFAIIPYSLTRAAYGGGSLGALTLNSLTAPLIQNGLPLAVWSIAIMGGLIGLSLFTYACGLSLKIYSTLFVQAVYYSYQATQAVTSFVLQNIGRLKGTSPNTTQSERSNIVKKKTAPKVKTSRKRAQETSKRATSEQQGGFDFGEAQEFIFPKLSYLQKPDNKKESISQSALEKNAALLQTVLEDFGISGEIVAVNPGPVVTLYELEPAPGIKSSRVISLADDIARSMAAISVRVAVIPGRNVIGIELPNQNRQTVYLRETLASESYEKDKSKLGLVLGHNIAGDNVIADLAKMPHLLIAGTTGSGKSVGVNAMILSLLYRMTPEQCRMIMIDPKMLELSIYDDIPHLLTPVVTDPRKAIVALKWAVREMENRYRAMSKLGVRNLEGYNMRMRKARDSGEILTHRVQTGFDADTGKPVFEDQPMDMHDLPYIVVVVDEFADLMLVAGKDVEAAIQRLAQMARAAGIHLIMATQRPSVDVITGTIKANFPSRISFQVTSRIDSRTILGDSGAEHLLGMGDMLFMSGGGRIERVHGPFVSDAEVERVVKHLKDQGAPQYIDSVTDEDENEFESGSVGDALFTGGNTSKGDALYDKALALIISEQKASTSFVQRHLSIGYNRAAKIIDQMEKEGVISAANHVGKRDVLIQNREFG